MRFIVSSNLLLKNLQSLGGVLSSSNTLPILDDFLFDVREEELVITASDLETTMTASIPVEKAEDPGIVAIPAKILLDTLKTLPDIPLSITVNPENYGVELSAGEGKYKLSGHNSDEFPKVPEMEDPNTIEMDASILSSAIHKTVFAAGNDELRPVMSGVFFEFSDEMITFVATDAHKLVRYKRLDIKSENSASFIVPKKPLNQLKGLLAGGDFPVKLEYSDTNACFTFNNIRLVCRLIEGKYPNYEAVIPKDNPNTLLVDRFSFMNSLRRVSLFANQSTHQVRVKIVGQELTLSAEDIDFSNEAKERLNCDYQGEDMEIGFNSRFLQEMVNNLNADEIKFELSAPSRAGILMPSQAENEDEDILMLVMPVMLNQ